MVDCPPLAGHELLRQRGRLHYPRACGGERPPSVRALRTAIQVPIPRPNAVELGDQLVVTPMF